MRAHVSQVAQLPLLIVGIAAVLLVTSGIAAVMAWTPADADGAGGAIASDAVAANPGGSADDEREVPAARPENDARLRAKCAECGMVESIREIERSAEGVDAGAVTAGGRTVQPGDPTGIREVTVRMKNGSSRVFTDATSAHWRPGQRMIVIVGASQSGN